MGRVDTAVEHNSLAFERKQHTRTAYFISGT
jgi:hypothetical protein